MSQSNTNTWIHLLHPVLHEALAAQPLLPARTADELAAMLARHETEEASTCPLLCTMGPNTIQRPQDPEEQEEYYSGKKKRHTLKNLLVIKETCHIAFLSYTYEGKASDKSLAELAGYTLPAWQLSLSR